MAQNDFLKRYVDASLAFTALTQARAEALVKEWVKAGEVQADQTREAVADLVERSRKNSEKLLETVRTEVRAQITNLGLASQADLDRIERRFSSLFSTATEAAPRAAKATATTATTVTKKATKATAKKTTTAKKKVAAKKAPAKKKAAAKKSTAKKKATAKKSTKKA